MLFIVEGVTDRESLELLLTEVVEEDNQVLFQVVGGDITSDNSINSSNVKNKITDIIKDSGKRKFKPNDYREIIHLVDMDAAFISEDSVYEDSTLDRFIYKDNGIYANDRETVIKRNNKKKKILDLLVSTSKVYRTIPYRVFYFSCNLEHVLHNERDADHKLKIKYAESFQDKYIDNLEEFVELLCNSDFTVKKQYKESWEFIKEDDNSIRRFTNFNIFLYEYLRKDKVHIDNMI